MVWVAEQLIRHWKLVLWAEKQVEATSRSALWPAGSKNSGRRGIRVGNQPVRNASVGEIYRAFHSVLGREIDA